jgi:hypothetical protein
VITFACHGGVRALLRGLSAATLALLLIGPDALAQARPKIWDMTFGTLVADLPDEEFVDPACGTNGGPPGLRLAGFEEFEKCRAEATGLREIWFRYDDEEEFIARAVRNPDAVARANTMVMLGQPIMLSLLADRAGRLQGYRIFTDPRAEPDLRKDAYLIGNAFKARYGNDGWGCQDEPQAAGETALEGIFIKQRCRKLADGHQVTIESRHYYKPGQALVDPNSGASTVNQFESSARIEVVAIEALQR